MTDNAPHPERICQNCAHLRWLVALGMGLRCKHPANATTGIGMLVPSRKHTCPYFEPKQAEPPRSAETS
jgi:hypothetical protein